MDVVEATPWYVGSMLSMALNGTSSLIYAVREGIGDIPDPRAKRNVVDVVNDGRGSPRREELVESPEG